MMFRALSKLLITAAALGMASSGSANIALSEGINVAISYTVDTITTLSGGADHKARVLDNLDVIVDADLDQWLGWTGGSVHIDVLNNMGGIPNNGSATLQGVDNIEVSTHRLRLFEAWIEQQLGERTTVRAGLYDLNSEFYTNETAALLIAPAFGIGSEVAATGPNGPSIFPSTAFALRIDRRIGETGYARAAVLNAHAGVLGDPGGVDFHFKDGMLGIVEAGVRGNSAFAVGAWRYSKRQDDIRFVNPAGLPVRRNAQGVYALVEFPLTEAGKPRAVSAFLRAGLSDGRTSPFTKGWQAGFLVKEVISGRADSQLSFGFNQAIMSSRFKANLADSGIMPAANETQFELTYADRLTDHFIVQPDVQWIIHPNGQKAGPNAVVGGLRLSIEL